MTQWVEETAGGRERGPAGLVRAWTTALWRPRQLFRSAVAPADQAPGLVFAALVVAIEEGTRFLLVPGVYPVLGERPLVSGLFWLALAVVLVAPAALHLIAALQTVILIPFVDDRAGVSETVQTIAYATAPCVVAGVPSPWIRVAATAYGAALLAIGISEVHDVSLPRGVVLSAVPGALVFGYAFRGFGALTAVVDQVWRGWVLPLV